MRHLRWDVVVVGGEHADVSLHSVRPREKPAVHTQDFAEFFWVQAGRGTHLINGRQRPLEPADIVFVRPTDAHGFRADGEAALKLLNVAFKGSTLSFLRDRYPAQFRAAWPSASRLPAHLRLGASDADWLQAHVNELSAAATRGRFETERFLLNTMDRLYSVLCGSAAPNAPQWIREALTRINDPKHFQRGTQGLSRLAGRSPAHVNRQLRRILNTTATDVVNRARMDYASRRLVMSDDKIIAISLQCGFSNLGHFYQLFRQRFGMSPGHYRRRKSSVVHDPRAADDDDVNSLHA